MRLQDKVCVITGGGSGIGRAAARHMAREGARVVIADWNAETGTAVVEEIRQAGHLAIFQQTDVSSSAECQAMVARALQEYGRLDVLFANAGIEPWQEDGFAHEVSEEVWDRIQAVNFRGMWLSCKYAAQPMLEQGHGVILITGSPTGITGCAANQVAYSASKGGVMGLARAMAVGYAPHNIRVNIIVPGSTETPMTAELFGDPDFRARAVAAVPAGRLGTAEDVSGLVVFLASDEARYCVGGYYMADGGLLAI